MRKEKTPMTGNILEYIENAAFQWPNRVAFADEHESLTFAELWQEARRIGSALIPHTVRQMPVAVVMTDRSVHCVATLLGVASAGCPFAPLDAAMPPERLQIILEQLQPVALLCDEATRDAVRQVPTSCPVLTVETLREAPVDEAALAALRQASSVWDILSIMFTSGSTGLPKGVAQSQYSYIAYTDATIDKYSFTQETVFGNQSPFFYANSIIDIYPPLKLGATVYILPGRCLSFPRMLVEQLRDHHITELTMTPSSYVKAAQAGVLEPGCLPELEYIILSGEAAHWQTLEAWMAAAPRAGVWNFYGSTEVFSVAVWRLNRAFADGETIPVGVPFSQVEVLIVDEDDNPVPRGERGLMLIRDPWLCAGYYRDKARTDGAFVIDPLGRGTYSRYFRTGDIGQFNGEGQLIVHGRADSQIKRAGYRMELGEVEYALRTIPGWENGCVLYDRDSGKLACFYEGALTRAEISRALKKMLPRYAVPDTFVQLEAMPYTATMKIDREKLRRMLTDA